MCFGRPISNPDDILLKGLELTRQGGNMVQGFATPARSTYTSAMVLETAKAHGYLLEKMSCRATYGDETRDGGVFKVVRKP